MSRIQQKIRYVAKLCYPGSDTYRVRTRWRCEREVRGTCIVKNPRIIAMTAELVLDGKVRLSSSIGGPKGTETRCLRSLLRTLSAIHYRNLRG